MGIVSDGIHSQALVRRGGAIIPSFLTKAVRNIPVGALLNKAIDALPVELHLLNYHFCGPGTKLKERLARNDQGIDKLDKACRDHDIAYSKYSDTSNRAVADKILADKAWERVKSSDASLRERTAALAVTAAMKAKGAIGAGVSTRRKKRSKVKRGRGNKQKRNVSGSGKVKRNIKKRSNRSIWTMIKSGKGLYLRPYQRVY